MQNIEYLENVFDKISEEIQTDVYFRYYEELDKLKVENLEFITLDDLRLKFQELYNKKIRISTILQKAIKEKYLKERIYELEYAKAMSECKETNKEKREAYSLLKTKQAYINYCNAKEFFEITKLHFDNITTAQDNLKSQIYVIQMQEKIGENISVKPEMLKFGGSHD